MIFSLICCYVLFQIDDLMQVLTSVPDIDVNTLSISAEVNDHGHIVRIVVYVDDDKTANNIADTLTQCEQSNI